MRLDWELSIAERATHTHIAVFIALQLDEMLNYHFDEIVVQILHLDGRVCSRNWMLRP